MWIQPQEPGLAAAAALRNQGKRWGARVWEWGGSLRDIIWEVLLSVHPTQDSCTPQRPCSAMKATHFLSSKPLRLNRREEGLQGHLRCPVLWGLRPS